MICKNPGGGTPPPNFTQGGVMDCHPPLETAYGFKQFKTFMREIQQNFNIFIHFRYFTKVQKGIFIAQRC